MAFTPRKQANADIIRERLSAKFRLEFIEIADESHKHSDHFAGPGSGTHLVLKIVSPDFRGLKPVARHRLIQAELHDLFQSGLHALAIQALTPEENSARD